VLGAEAGRNLRDWVHDHDLAQWVWPVGSLVVLGSIVIHGITATPVTRWYMRAVTTS
jgi:NhaP-type Na+/H+ or K+/H+ antiporter